MRHQRCWTTTKEFARIHEITNSSILLRKFHGYVPKEAFKYFSKRTVLIDSNFIQRRWKFKQKVILFNQDMYYTMTENMSALALATLYAPQVNRSIRSIRTWMQVGLWTTKDDSMLDYKVTKYHWEFYRYFKRMNKC